MSNPPWFPCPQCGVSIDEYGWEEPGKEDFALEPHVCEYLVDIKATVVGSGIMACILIIWVFGL